MQRIISYCRVSTDEQAEQGVSLESQREKVNGYCAVYDLQIMAELSDPGKSAKNMDRPGVQAALQLLRDGKADGIVVYSLSRLTRSIGDMQIMLAEFFGDKPKNRKQLYSVTEHVDTTTAIGRMVLNILLAVNQAEREVTGERTKAALQHKISKNERVGSIRYGHDLAADGKTLIPNAAEQQAIALMRQLQAAGTTYREIAAALEDRGTPSKKGKQWSASAVYYILKRQLPADAA
jgi:DNA invertase Pin-like site-specific DNA recombinase